jgi:hypothetical protein
VPVRLAYCCHTSLGEGPGIRKKSIFPVSDSHRVFFPTADAVSEISMNVSDGLNQNIPYSKDKEKGLASSHPDNWLTYTDVSPRPSSALGTPCPSMTGM